jgi:hypothetical protein
MDSDFPNEFVVEILTLLDLIEQKKSSKLAKQRHDIAKKHGITIVVGEPVSNKLN